MENIFFRLGRITTWHKYYKTGNACVCIVVHSFWQEMLLKCTNICMPIHKNIWAFLITLAKEAWYIF